MFTSARPTPASPLGVLGTSRLTAGVVPTFTSVRLAGKRAAVPAEPAWQPDAPCLAIRGAQGSLPGSVQDLAPPGPSSGLGDRVALILRGVLCRSLTFSEIGKLFCVPVCVS